MVVFILQEGKMIRKQWYVVLESNEVGAKPIGVTRMGEKMVYWRDSTGRVHCAVDKCPHRGIQLSLGKVTDDHLQCPFHGFEYDASGACVYIPAIGKNGAIPARMRLRTYPTYEAHGFIWVWWGEDPPAELEPPPFFDNLDDTFYYASAHDPWDAHYSRVIENQLDVVHLPFIHRTTIGRGGRTVVDGPYIEWHGDRMLYTYVFNRVDDGTPPRKPSELSPKEAGSVHLEFIMPNLWQNYISPDVRIVAAFVPVDDAHTLLYLRFYQRFLTVPVLGKLIAKLAMPFNIFVAHQDRRVVVTHQPQKSGLNIGEILIQGDLPIIEYRRKREAWKKQAESSRR
jgi:phenylpropionate dioxygenase-like ring-hydroxylating dioxygenase large terminal subunit